MAIASSSRVSARSTSSAAHSHTVFPGRFVRSNSLLRGAGACRTPFECCSRGTALANAPVTLPKQPEGTDDDCSDADQGAPGSRDSSFASATSRRVIHVPLPVLGVVHGVREAFHGLCIATGLQVLEAMMEADRAVLCGPKGRHQVERSAGRGGSVESPVTLGGRQVEVPRLSGCGARTAR